MAKLQREQGIEIHWEERGDGPPVVLAPYSNFHPTVFDPIAAELAPDHRVIRYDDRGAGQSTRTGPHDMDTGAGDLAAVIEASGAPAVIVGLGDAANRAVRVYAERPELVEAIVTLGLPAGRHRLGQSEAMAASDTVVNAFLSMCETDYRGALRSLVTAGNPQMSEDEIRERARMQFDYQPQDTAVARLRAWVDDDALGAGARLRRPALAALRRQHGGRLVPGGPGGDGARPPALPRSARRGNRGRDHRGPT